MFKFAVTKAVIVTALASATLFAAPAAFARSVEVRYADLDLTTDTGRVELDRRVVRAARGVCLVHEPTTGSMLMPRVDYGCYQRALAGTREHVAAAVERAGDTQLGG